MNRRRNIALVGLLVVGITLLTYAPIYSQWQRDHDYCTETLQPNRAKSDKRAELNADGWHSGAVSKEALAKINRESGDFKVARENEHLARELYAIEKQLRVDLKSPSCDDTYPRPKVLGLF